MKGKESPEVRTLNESERKILFLVEYAMIQDDPAIFERLSNLFFNKSNTAYSLQRLTNN